MTRSKWFLILAAGLLIAADAKEDKKKELDKLQGTWSLVGGEERGQKLPEDQVKALNLRLTIKGEDFTFKAGEETMKGTIKIDPSKKPMTLDAKVTDAQGGNAHESRGIYKIEGDTLTVAYVFGDKPRPTEFKTDANTGSILSVYKKVKE